MQLSSPKYYPFKDYIYWLEGFWGGDAQQTYVLIANQLNADEDNCRFIRLSQDCWTVSEVEEIANVYSNMVLNGEISEMPNSELGYWNLKQVEIIDEVKKRLLLPKSNDKVERFFTGLYKVSQSDHPRFRAIFYPKSWQDNVPYNTPPETWDDAYKTEIDSVIAGAKNIGSSIMTTLKWLIAAVIIGGGAYLAYRFVPQFWTNKK